MGYEPGHRTDGHTAHLALDVVSDLLHSERDDTSKKRGREDVVKRMQGMVGGHCVIRKLEWHKGKNEKSAKSLVLWDVTAVAIS